MGIKLLLYSGHYYCYIRNMDKWYFCSDESISQATEEQVAQSEPYFFDLFRYLLFYIRRKSSPIP